MGCCSTPVIAPSGGTDADMLTLLLIPIYTWLVYPSSSQAIQVPEDCLRIVVSDTGATPTCGQVLILLALVSNIRVKHYQGISLNINGLCSFKRE